MSGNPTSNPQDGLLDRVRRRLASDAEILVNDGDICTSDDWDEVRDYLSLLQLADDQRAEIERLTAERDTWRKRHDREREAHAANLKKQIKVEAERDRLRAAQSEAVRILSAIEFDGQAYEAIQRACKLLTEQSVEKTP